MDFLDGPNLITSIFMKKGRRAQNQKTRCDHSMRDKRERFEDITLLALKMEERAMGRGIL